MDELGFDQLIKSAIKEIPKEFLDKLDNLSIFVDDYPTKEQLRKVGMKHGFLLGLYEGVPHTKRGRYGFGPTVPDRITLFRIPILSMAKSKGHAINIVKGTLMHEIAHHFGMDEAMVRKAEQERTKRKR